MWSQYLKVSGSNPTDDEWMEWRMNICSDAANKTKIEETTNGLQIKHLNKTSENPLI